MTDRPATIEAEDNLATPYDTADPAQVNAARKKDARHRRSRLDVVAGLMDLKEGRAWAHGFLDSAHIWTPSFVQGDPYATAFKEGERNMGLRFLADIMASAPARYVAMIEEAAGRV